jgi:hypothetical protein
MGGTPGSLREEFMPDQIAPEYKEADRYRPQPGEYRTGAYGRDRPQCSVRPQFWLAGSDNRLRNCVPHLLSLIRSQTDISRTAPNRKAHSARSMLDEGSLVLFGPEQSFFFLDDGRPFDFFSFLPPHVATLAEVLV